MMISYYCCRISSLGLSSSQHLGKRRVPQNHSVHPSEAPLAVPGTETNAPDSMVAAMVTSTRGSPVSTSTKQWRAPSGASATATEPAPGTSL